MNSEPSLVVVIDDDALVRQGLTALLKSHGYAVLVCASAREYLDGPVPNGPACLVLDVKMPGLGGLELQHALIENGRDDVIIFITGHGDVPMCRQAMKAGAADFLEKPFSNAALLAAVAGALTTARDRQQEQISRARAWESLGSLAPREREVFRYIIAGFLSKQIAAKLGTSLKTVENQRAQIMAKLGVNSVAEMVWMAARAGQPPADADEAR